MKKKAINTTIAALVMVLLLVTMLSACGSKNKEEGTDEPDSTTGAVSTTEPVGTSEAQIEIDRQDGDHFEDVIAFPDMEETIRYEHIRNDTIGFEMDYDYERFERRSESGRECFVLRYDNPEDPENYLEVTYNTEDADAVSTSVSEVLSNDYDIIKESFTLDRAGSCIKIDASEVKGSGGTPDLMQTVYIIPSGEGCLVVTSHYSYDSGDEYGVRIRHIMNTLKIIERHAESGLTGTWATASMGYEFEGTMQPMYYVQFTDSKINYGHMKAEEFVPDHSDKISSLEEFAEGRFRIHAETSDGNQYTYQTSVSENNTLEYYGTWQEDEFSEKYSGGSSLSRID